MEIMLFKWKLQLLMIKKQNNLQLTALQFSHKNIGLLMVLFMPTMLLFLLKHM